MSATGCVSYSGHGGLEQQQMLVLTRKVGQSIVIGDNIEVVVLEVRGEQVRVGIRAPKDVTVHRKEVYEQIQGEDTPPEEA